MDSFFIFGWGTTTDSMSISFKCVAVATAAVDISSAGVYCSSNRHTCAVHVLACSRLVNQTMPSCFAVLCKPSPTLCVLCVVPCCAMLCRLQCSTSHQAT